MKLARHMRCELHTHTHTHIGLRAATHPATTGPCSIQRKSVIRLVSKDEWRMEPRARRDKEGKGQETLTE